MSCNADCLDQKDYENGIFGCLNDPTICLFACFCPCVVIGQAVGKAEDKKFNIPSCLLAPLGGYRLRRDVAELHQDKQSKDGSILSAICCFSCSVCQDAHEINKRVKTQSSSTPPTSNSAPAPVEAPINQ